MHDGKLKPALIIGSGFHRHVFGDVDNEPARPLYDWQYLVTQTARAMRVAAPDDNLPPTLRWEVLINRAGKEGYLGKDGHWVENGEKQASDIERVARGYVKDGLTEAAQNYPKSTRSPIPLASCWGCVISLNFDSAWIEAHGIEGTTQTNDEADGSNARWRQQLSSYRAIPEDHSASIRRVWFPNGGAHAQSTIRMGVHDYGSAPHAARSGFNHLKRWESDNSIDSQNTEKYEAVVTGLQRRDRVDGPSTSSDSALETWVANFLYRPLIFAGVGLPDQESAFWWLLVQRTRNRMRATGSSGVYFLADGRDRPNFWHTKPLGIDPVFCTYWGDGWQKVVELGWDLSQRAVH